MDFVAIRPEDARSPTCAVVRVFQPATGGVSDFDKLVGTGVLHRGGAGGVGDRNEIATVVDESLGRAVWIGLRSDPPVGVIGVGNQVATAIGLKREVADRIVVQSLTRAVGVRREDEVSSRIIAVIGDGPIRIGQREQSDRRQGVAVRCLVAECVGEACQVASRVVGRCRSVACRVGCAQESPKGVVGIPSHVRQGVALGEQETSLIIEQVGGLSRRIRFGNLPPEAIGNRDRGIHADWPLRCLRKTPRSVVMEILISPRPMDLQKCALSGGRPGKIVYVLGDLPVRSRNSGEALFGVTELGNSAVGVFNGRDDPVRIVGNCEELAGRMGETREPAIRIAEGDAIAVRVGLVIEPTIRQKTNDRAVEFADFECASRNLHESGRVAWLRQIAAATIRVELPLCSERTFDYDRAVGLRLQRGIPGVGRAVPEGTERVASHQVARVQPLKRECEPWG